MTKWKPLDWSEYKIDFHSMYGPHIFQLKTGTESFTYWKSNSSFGLSSFKNKMVGLFVNKNCMIEIDQLEDFALLLFNKGQFDYLKSWNPFEKVDFSTSPCLLFIYVHLLLLEEEYQQAIEFLRAIKQSNEYLFNRNKLLRNEISFLESVLLHIDGHPTGPFESVTSNNQFMNNNNSLFKFPSINVGHASLLQSPICYKGNIGQAKDIYSKLLLKVGLARIAMSSMSYCNIAMGEIFYETGEINKALKFLPVTLCYAERNKDLGNIIPIKLIQAKILTAHGDCIDALSILNQLESDLRKDKHSHWITVIQSQKARILMADGNKKELLNWLTSQSTVISKAAVSNLTLFSFLTLTQVYVSLKKLEEANDLLTKVRNFIEKNNEEGIGMKIEMYVLQAICNRHLTNPLQSDVQLLKALSLGNKYGYYHTFLDMGELLIPLLKCWLKRSSNTKICDRNLLIYGEKILLGLLKRLC
ncbi:tetratricopeptide (TPR) repeat protein [Evansella vedderi]|uniref:Tetratricopeptide (TPR) repeat protein n=1 Tax=Evansella vedderi TaxID=38282 RepID=A0ABT9ZT29_9BACI|nr:hypothetical protein [Evansella vedderi]MDQ0254019.1 tetratricopeptide (TPR) repeat protein [Evansella vedderi]